MKNCNYDNLVQLQINLPLILDFNFENFTCETTSTSTGLCGFLFYTQYNIHVLVY